MAGSLTRVCLENYTNRPRSLRHDAMNLSAYAGEGVVLEWRE